MSEINYSKLPNFLVIGAPKCGTTSLHSILGQHSEIYTTVVKEPHFFEREVYQNGLYWYQEKYFRNAEGFLARGESTPNYLTLSSIVAPRIKESYQDNEIRFVAIFRDPVKRAYSEYWFRKRRFKEDETFANALEDEWQGKRNDWDSIFKGGCYATLLQPFLDNFDRKRFHFLLLEDLIIDLIGTMKGLTQFLSVNDGYDFKPMVENQSYVIKSRRFHSITKNTEDPLYRFGKAISQILPVETVHTLKRVIKNANLARVDYPPLDKEYENFIRKKYLPEIQKLEIIMGKSLSSWYQV